MNAILIVNHAAGAQNGASDTVVAEDLSAAFLAEGVNVEVRIAQASAICRTFEAAVAEKPDAIFVGGGDGTISTAAACLAGTGIALGVLPLGTLNHFARDLGLPTEWREVVPALVRGERRAVDVGEVNGRVFINNCSIGSYPDAVRRRELLRRTHGHGKWWAMLIATITVLRRLRRIRAHVQTPARTIALRSPFIVVANNAYSARAIDYSLRPRLDEGRLWIYTTRAARTGTILRLMWQSLRRAIDQVDGLETLEVTEATLTSDRGGPLPIAVDGELVTLTEPLRFRTRPGALIVLAPRLAAEPAAATPSAPATTIAAR
jgi:diacylglycerol kinase family enzyme